ncbi:hypothetical protein TSOC_006757, partial [Tetrabaena socialis]
DLCCGEGSAAAYLAATEGWQVTGVEIVPAAAQAARALAEEYGTVVRVKLTAAAAESEAAAAGDAAPIRLSLSYTRVADLVRIATASVHCLPLPSCSYDVVFGQDPDGLAHADRLHAFREVFRVLRPGGLFYFWHHWIPGPGWPAALLAEYQADSITAAPRLSYQCYLEDLKASGLQLASASDCTALAMHHMRATAALMRAADDGTQPDAWLVRVLQYAERGGSMGIQVVAYKPME